MQLCLSNHSYGNNIKLDSPEKALEEIDKVQSGIDEELPSDLMAIDVREALYHLGEITGQVTNDQLLGNIFANFCIGKWISKFLVSFKFIYFHLIEYQQVVKNYFFSWFLLITYFHTFISPNFHLDTTFNSRGEKISPRIWK